LGYLNVGSITVNGGTLDLSETTALPTVSYTGGTIILSEDLDEKAAAAFIESLGSSVSVKVRGSSGDVAAYLVKFITDGESTAPPDILVASGSILQR
jgi:hypothetical protein